MRLWSTAWRNGEPLPARHARARCAEDGRLVAADNLSPPLAWSGLPPGTRSLVLLALDFDALAPNATAQATAQALAQRSTPAPGHEWPVDAPRHEQVHWLLVNLPAGEAQLAEGQPGYDGPQPPANDALVHHLVFALYALAVERLQVDDRCTPAQLRQAMAGLVLGSATHSGTYTLNWRLIGQAA